MNSVASSVEAEDWLDISDSVSLPSLSLDDVLNEVSQLSDELLDGHLSGSVDQISPSPVAATPSYKLDSAVKVERLDSISHQLVSFRSKNGSAVAVAHSKSHTAVATSKGSLLLFDAEGRLERFRHGDELDGSASCVAFSDGGGHVAVGYSKGFVKIINTKSGTVEHLIHEAVQIGRGVLEIRFLGSRHTILTLDSGGSVFEIHTRQAFRIAGKSRIRCVFSGCNGEVVHMRLLPYSLLALLTVSKILIVSTRLGGSIVCAFPMETSPSFPPLLDFIEEDRPTHGQRSAVRICVGRANALSIFRLNPHNIGTKKKSVVFVHKIHLEQPVVNFGFITKSLLVAFDEKGVCSTIRDEKQVSQDVSTHRIPLLFSTSDFKGLTTGGNVSPAMQYLAERACYQSLCRKGSSDCLIALSHDELFELTPLSEDDQLELFNSRGDFVSACYYLFDIHRSRVRADRKFLERVPNLLSVQMRRLVEFAMSGCKEGKVSDLIAHYKTYISILLTVCVGTQMYTFLYGEIWPRVERDVLSRYIFLESLDEFVLDGTLWSPPPALVSAYMNHLASEGHFSQLQASIVRFPIQSIDLHYVMSTCKQNGLYDGIIYVMNKALGDYLSPLEEMLSDVASFASNEVLSDSEVERGNRLLLYLHCCLAGHAYPYGTLPPEQLSTVPVQVYRCITSLKGKDGTSSDVSYPYLRLLLLFDAQQFTHVIRTCADAPLFQSEGRLQRLVENIGRISMELRDESALVHFLLLISQLVDTSGVVTPVEIVEDVVTILMRMKWQHSSAEFAIVEILRAVPQLDRKAVLRMASSPMRKEICTFIYCGERKFVDLINCYIRDAENEGIFSVIRRILRTDLNQQEYREISEVVCQLIPRLTAVNARECADLVISFFPNYLLNLRSHTKEERMASFPLLQAAFAIKRERQENFLQMDEDVEEHLFGIVFEGLIKEEVENLDSTLQDLLLYWLPTGSRTDFCLNLAAEAECTNSTILLMETRNRLTDAFEILFKEIAESEGDRQRFVLWLDKGLSFCSRHTSSALSKEWLIRIMRTVTRAVIENDTTDMEFRLQSLAGGILENGSEHSLELVECLLEYPAFKNGLFRDYAPLINKILGTCSHETFLIKQLLLCIDEESSEELSLLQKLFSRKIGDFIEDECVQCRSSVTKAAYIFGCGHLIHMECDNGSRKCPCVNEVPERLEQRRFDMHMSMLRPRYQHKFQTTRDIFQKWDDPLLLVPH
ncbi:Vacuolar protein sorting-associated protein 8 [Trichostrongylus colubriformis]|uniref:Vacuolar protein sorting-associated protein 8 n=1 Tax=Trichostrongylus colubriformis TaxID=6319 RepID=A0AAN8IUM7_TRICO